MMHKHINHWGLEYFKFLIRNSLNPYKKYPIHILFCFVDHYEPGHGGVDEKKMDERVLYWREYYPKMASNHHDADGCFPRHSWFYPPHYYQKKYLDWLGQLCKQGYGEIELHLHHQDDTPETLKNKILEVIELYNQSGVLISSELNPKKYYGFIHGNWALDNSRYGKYCGVNNELIVLKETGCYADFTMPSVNEAQSKKINSIYYAKDDPDKPKSYDWGMDVEVGKSANGDLMIIQGPLAFNWRNWRHIFYPALDFGDITDDDPPITSRIDLWVKCHIHVIGKPDWVFIKIHTHGAL